MRVAVVTIDTPQIVDTARTRRLDRLARSLAGRGHDVVVLCTQWWEGSVSSFEQDEVTYRRVTEDRSPHRFAARLPITLHNVDSDLIHAGHAPTGVAVSAGVTRWLGRVPVVLDWFGDGSVDRTGRASHAALRLPSAIVVPSRHVETTVREMGASETRTRIVPESIDIKRIKSSPIADGPDVVTAGRLDEHANVDMLLLGLAELRDHDWTAMVIGDGPARQRYERKAAELRIADRVHFPGSLTRERRLAHYRAAHAFVQTAERCPFATELLWALAAGCVGIVDYQERSAAHELVETLDRGFRTTDPEALSEAIVAAGDLEELTFDDAFATYDHAQVLEQYLAIYEELLA